LNQFYDPFNRYHEQIEDTDIAVHNHYQGNSKFAAVSFDTSDPGRWLIHFELIVDGERVWTYDWEYKKKTSS
jgi:alkaline phosphatase D